jgi:hypothetical protein
MVWAQLAPFLGMRVLSNSGLAKGSNLEILSGLHTEGACNIVCSSWSAALRTTRLWNGLTVNLRILCDYRTDIRHTPHSELPVHHIITDNHQPPPPSHARFEGFNPTPTPSRISTAKLGETGRAYKGALFLSSFLSFSIVANYY